MGDTILQCPFCRGKLTSTTILHKAQAGQQAQAHIFQQSVSSLDTANPPITTNKTSFWQSDGFKYSFAGTFAAGVLWGIGMPGPVIACGALLAGVGLHVYKIWQHRPARAAGPAEPRATKIQIEQWTDDNRHVLLDEIRDERISIDDLRKVARAINNGSNFSRPGLSSVISQAKYHRIKSEFERLNYAFTTPANQTILTPRAKAFLRKLSTLP